MNVPFTTASRPPAPGPDGLVRFGLVTLSTDLTIEHDLSRLWPDRARLHVSRVAYANPTTPENLAAMAPHIGAAADLITVGTPLAAIGFGCTSGAVVIGDDVIAQAIGLSHPGIPVFTPPQSACLAFRALGVKRIALLTPYLAETTRPMIDYFTDAGFTLVSAYGLGMADDRDIGRLTPAMITAAADEANHPEAEAMFISCTATPVLPLIDALEERLGKPVVSSNQALARAMLDAGGMTASGPGRLFALPQGATCL